MSADESPDPAQKHICDKCVKESYLRRLIQNTGTRRTCSYCQNTLPTISIPALTDEVDKAFADHYEWTPCEPEGHEATLNLDPDCRLEWEREGDPAQVAIESAAGIASEPAEDIRNALEMRHGDHRSYKSETEDPFSKGSHYALKYPDQGDFDAKWQEFETELKTQTRFFSKNAKQILDRIFDNLENLQTTEGKSVVVSAGPNDHISSLSRARVFAGPEVELREALCAPWKHLGTPPSNAARAGRMNAHGIAVFYGALNPETALAEVRPPVGSKVAIAEFKIIRPLRLLDLAALRKIDSEGSIFDPDTLPKQQRAGFLATLSELLYAPVMPGDEASEYLTTQAVADYLATVADLDGIIFPSVQTGGNSSNVVLFRHAACVIEEPTTEIGTFASLQMHDSDGVHPGYMVFKVQKPAESADNRDVAIKPEFPLLYGEPVVPPNEPDPALKIDLAKIRIHHVEAVRYEHSSHAVERIKVMEVRQDSTPPATLQL